MAFSSPYARKAYDVRAPRLSELLMRRGDAEAAAALRSGAAWAQGIQGAGQAVSGGLQQYAKELAEAPLRAAQVEQVNAQTDMARSATAENEAQTQAIGARAAADQLSIERRQKAEAQVFGWMEANNGQIPPPQVIASAYGGDLAGMKVAIDVAQGVMGLHKLQTQTTQDVRKDAGRTAAMYLNATPETRQKLWATVREAAITSGLVPEEALDPTTPPSDEDLVSFVRQSGYEMQAPPALMNLGARGVFDPKTRQVIEGTAAPEAPVREPTPTEASLALRAAQGDKAAAQALKFLKAQRASEGGGTPAQEPLVAVIGADGNPVLMPRSQAAGKRPASTREQGRAVTSGDAGDLADFDTSLDDLRVLRETVSSNGATGTSAKIGAMLPNAVTDITGWGTSAKQKQAVIDRVKQVIGKTLEGGVLRKEDEAKYKNILPTIGERKEIVASKIAGLEKAISLRKQRRLDALADSGYDVSKHQSRTAPTPAKVGRFTVEVEP
jgi:hypothetical protein